MTASDSFCLLVDHTGIKRNSYEDTNPSMNNRQLPPERVNSPLMPPKGKKDSLAIRCKVYFENLKKKKAN